MVMNFKVHKVSGRGQVVLVFNWGRGWSILGCLKRGRKKYTFKDLLVSIHLDSIGHILQNKIKHCSTHAIQSPKENL